MIVVGGFTIIGVVRVVGVVGVVGVHVVAANVLWIVTT